ncbi:MAG: hypothetical protein ABI354_02265 [Candidatus Saccharimonadales bacterium]
MEQQEAREILLTNKVVVDMLDRRDAVEIVSAMGLVAIVPTTPEMPIPSQRDTAPAARYIVDL